MGQPVKLSSALILEARLSAGLSQRSLAGQIEFWAGLGRAIDPLLRGRQALALSTGRSVAQCLDDSDSPLGAQRVKEYLASRPFPHYEVVSGLLVKIDEDGTKTPGRFVNRQFIPAP